MEGGGVRREFGQSLHIVHLYIALIHIFGASFPKHHPHRNIIFLAKIPLPKALDTPSLHNCTYVKKYLEHSLILGCQS